MSPDSLEHCARVTGLPETIMSSRLKKQYRVLHNLRLHLPFGPSFGFSAIFENPIRGSFTVDVGNFDAEIMNFTFGFGGLLFHCSILAKLIFHRDTEVLLLNLRASLDRHSPRL